jgi:hypothetical protein
MSDYRFGEILENLERIEAAIATIPGVIPPVDRTPTIRVETGVFTVQPGYKRVWIAVTGTAPVIVLGASIPSGTSIPFEIDSNDNGLAITGNAIGSSVLISEIR